MRKDIKIKQFRHGFTLIEMLVSTAIFALVVVIAADVFGSASKLQASTKAVSANQQLSTQISDSIFRDLKSAISWGQVTTSNGLSGTPNKIKGFASFKFDRSTANLTLNSPPQDANLIIGFYPAGGQTSATLYYYNSGHLYHLADDSRNFSASTTSITASDLVNLINGISDNDSRELKADGSQIDSLTIGGSNYLSSTTERTQPFLDAKLTVSSNLNFVGGIKNIMETRISLSSRNFSEAPK